MSDVRMPSKDFAERLREALDEHTTATTRTGRRKRRHAEKAPSSTLANPARVRDDEELFADRLRNALD
jgi:hypothetical protein